MDKVSRRGMIGLAIGASLAPLLPKLAPVPYAIGGTLLPAGGTLPLVGEQPNVLVVNYEVWTRIKAECAKLGLDEPDRRF